MYPMQTVRTVPYLTRRGNSFYFRREIPSDLRNKLGRREYKISLRTGYLRSAQSMIICLSGYTDRLFRLLRNGTMAELTNEQIQTLADQWLQDALEEAEIERATATRPKTISQVGDLDEGLIFLQHELREQLVLSDYRHVQHHVDIFLEANPEPSIEKGSEDYKLLSREVLKRFIEFCRIERNRNKGDYSDTIPTSTSTSPSGLPQPVRPKSELMTLSEAVEKYIYDKTHGTKPWAKSSQKDIPPQVKQFAQIVGEEKLIGDLSRDDMRKYQEAMLKLPSRRRSTPYRDKSLKQLLRMNIPEGERLSPKTLDTRFTNIRTFLNWAELEGCINRSKPLNAILVAPEAESDSPKRRPFSQEELQRLFHPDGYGKGRLFTKPWQFWIPLLSLFSGARAEELTQLYVSDIKKIDDVWIMDINESGDKRVKTKAGNRKVPIHPFILNDLKFLDFVSWSKKMKGKQLFKELKVRESSGNRSGAVSQWFTRYRRKCGVGAMKGTSDLTFHSFRHTVITWCKHNDINRYKYKEVVGHEQGETKDVTSGYEGSYPADMMLREVIAPLDFHITIPLNHLKDLKWTKW